MSKTTASPARTRKLDVPETADEKAAKEVAKIDMAQRIAAKQEKLIAAEKRWMRKLRLSTTKLRKIRTAQRRLNKRKEQLT